ncbi:MAG: hypothetical protein AAB434_06380 [Planctomycetota bacterium]
MIDLSTEPLAEFHLHFEAALPWEVFRGLAGMDGERAPWLDGSGRFASFDDFAKPFRGCIAETLRRPGMYERWAEASVRWLAGLGVRHAEIGVTAYLMERLGHRVEETLPAVCRVLQESGEAAGLRVRIFAAISRREEPEENARQVEQWLALVGGRLAGIDLHSYELEGPTARQRPAFDVARAAGLELRAHAGEHGTARDVWEAIDVLGATSINHGVRAVDDPVLVRALASRNIPLHVCPTSNVMLGVAPSYAEHPLRTLLTAGVPVTVNTDDPLVLGTDVRSEYGRLRREMGLGEDEVLRVLATATRLASARATT